MITDILFDAGIPAKEARFPDPPDDAYAVYFDDVEAYGADQGNPIVRHDCTVEIYERVKDAALFRRMEVALNARGVPWTKQARYWLDSVRRYQTIYEFSYIEKT